MKRFLLVVAACALPSLAQAQQTQNFTAGFFNAAITLTDVGGHTQLTLKVQNTQGAGAAVPIAQGEFIIEGLQWLQYPANLKEIDLIASSISLIGPATVQYAEGSGSGQPRPSLWTFADPDANGLGRLMEDVWFAMAVGGCTPLTLAQTNSNYDYVQTCGPGAFLETVYQLPGTATFSDVTTFQYTPCVSGDGCSATTTPEPASLVLLATGLVGFAGVGSLGRSRRGA